MEGELEMMESGVEREREGRGDEEEPPAGRKGAWWYFLYLKSVESFFSLVIFGISGLFSFFRASAAIWTISTSLADALIIVRTRNLRRNSRRAVVWEQVGLEETGCRKVSFRVLIASPSREGRESVGTILAGQRGPASKYQLLALHEHAQAVSGLGLG